MFSTSGICRTETQKLKQMAKMLSRHFILWLSDSRDL